MGADIEDPPVCLETVLKRLKLEDLTEKFQTEHITPDIVCKLSVHEMEMLGINSCSDMMSLRIECTKFGGQALKKLEGTCGAPIFFIPQSLLGDLLQVESKNSESAVY